MKVNEVLKMANGINGLDFISDIIDKDNDRVITFYLDDMFLNDNWDEVENENVDWNNYEQLIDELDEKGKIWSDYPIIYQLEDGFIKINCASEDF